MGQILTYDTEKQVLKQKLIDAFDEVDEILIHHAIEEAFRLGEQKALQVGAHHKEEVK